MGTPFKMKGSPMQRNFGIGSPLRAEEKPVKGGTLPEVKVSGGKKTKHKDITDRGGWNKKIREGIKKGQVRVYERADGSTYQRWSGGEDYERVKAEKRDIASE